METSFVKNENDFQKLKILITGGNGFLAGRFAKYFHNLYDFILLGRQELDVRDEKKTMELFQFHKPQIVIHSAAVANTLTCENEPQFSYDVNVKGSLNVGKACLAIKAKLLFLSTEQIFNSKTTRGPHKEEDEPQTRTNYGRQKIEAEKQLKELMNNELWIVRLSWLFGLPERNSGNLTSNILWTTLQALLKNQKMAVNVHEYRGMTYVYDAIPALQKILESAPFGTYHLSSENNESRYDIVIYILQLLGIESQRIEQLVEKDEKTFTVEAPRDIRVDTTKLKQLGIDLGTTKEGLVKCLREFNYIK